MTITFSGDSFESTNRILTQCHSLDWALGDHLGNVGYPTKSVTEVYGAKGTGKTTLCTSIMGIIASKLQKNVTLLDWEGQSKETIEGILSAQNFYGTVNYLLNKSDESPEETLERFVAEIKDEEQNVALMDSLGAFTPGAMIEGKIGDANMGVMAREIGQFVSKVLHFTRQADEPGAIFLTNHLHPKIGSMVTGQDTSGGEKKKFLAHIRIDVKRTYIANSSVSFGESYLLRGHVDHNRFGFDKRDFYVFILGGQGIHVGLTALWDCVMKKIATLSAKSIGLGTVVSLDGKSYGKIATIIEHRNEDPEFFVPFMNALRSETEQIDETGELTYDAWEKSQEEEPKKKGKRK